MVSFRCLRNRRMARPRAGLVGARVGVVVPARSGTVSTYPTIWLKRMAARVARPLPALLSQSAMRGAPARRSADGSEVPPRPRGDERYHSA